MSVLRPHLASLLLAGLLAPALAAQDLPLDPPGAGDVALMGTIPIYWGERAEMADLLAADAAPHWARGVIETQYRLRPLDYLSAEALAGHRRLLLAQPRGLSAEENFALDAWVRGGGQLLLFADPMMTAHSRFGLGDRRRPQDVALLSPILAHWGLELRFDEGQLEGLQMRDGVPPGQFPALPVNLPGELALTGADASCTLLAEGIAADCRLGEGSALVIADAALFDEEGADEALLGLLARIYGNLVPPPAPLALRRSNSM